MNKYPYLLLLIFILSCGKRTQDSEEKEIIKEPLPDGTFKAVLRTSNLNISTDINGYAKILKYGDDFNVNVQLNNAKNEIYHQHLQTGQKCPTSSDDKNEDGIIDYSESRKKLGSSLIPFDDNLASQKEGSNLELQGNYLYQRSTSYYLMLADLHEPDEFDYDSVIKLDEKDLILDDKVIVVYISRIKVNDIDYKDIPIACGKLIRQNHDENWNETDSLPEVSTTEFPENTKPPVSPFSSPPVTNEGSSCEEYEDEENENHNRWWDKLMQRWRRFVTSISRSPTNKNSDLNENTFESNL